MTNGAVVTSHLSHQVMPNSRSNFSKYRINNAKPEMQTMKCLILFFILIQPHNSVLGAVKRTETFHILRQCRQQEEVRREEGKHFQLSQSVLKQVGCLVVEPFGFRLTGHLTRRISRKIQNGASMERRMNILETVYGDTRLVWWIPPVISIRTHGKDKKIFYFLEGFGEETQKSCFIEYGRELNYFRYRESVKIWFYGVGNWRMEHVTSIEDFQFDRTI